MTIAELMLSQLSDPFRIGLLLALVITAYNTAGAVGLLTPLALGAVFVAVLIPVTTSASESVGLTAAILSGVVVNAAWIGVILAARSMWKRATTAKDG